MSGYSEAARRMAAASKGIVVPELDADEQVESVDTELPNRVPLDRRRDVLLDEMSRDEVVRARNQAQRRVDKNPDGPNTERYRSYLAATEAELESRPDEVPPPVFEDDEPKTVGSFVEPEDAPLPLGDRPRFASHPDDTPESPAL